MLDYILRGAGEGMGSAVAGGLGGLIDDKWFGGGKTQRDPIQDAVNLMDALYPGTTPYERLNAGGGGAAGISNASMSGEAQKEMQENQLRAQRSISTMQVLGQLAAADRSASASEYAADAGVHNEILRQRGISLFGSKIPIAGLFAQSPFDPNAKGGKRKGVSLPSIWKTIKDLMPKSEKMQKTSVSPVDKSKKRPPGHKNYKSDDVDLYDMLNQLPF